MKNRESQWSDMTLPSAAKAAASVPQSSLMAEEKLPEDELYDRVRYFFPSIEVHLQSDHLSVHSNWFLFIFHFIS